MAPRRPQEGYKTAPDGHKTAPDGHKTAPDGPKLAHDKAFFRSLSNYIELTTTAGPIIKEGAAVFDPPPPSVEREHGVLKTTMGQVPNSSKSSNGRSRQGPGAIHQRPARGALGASLGPLVGKIRWQKNAIFSPNVSSWVVLGPLRAVFGLACGLLEPCSHPLGTAFCNFQRLRSFLSRLVTIFR